MIDLMARNTKNVTYSLPPSSIAKVEEMTAAAVKTDATYNKSDTARKAIDKLYEEFLKEQGKK